MDSLLESKANEDFFFPAAKCIVSSSNTKSKNKRVGSFRKLTD